MHSSPLHNHLAEAWNITQNGQKIRRFNFFGSLFDTIMLSITFIYQIGIIWLDIMHKSSDFFQGLRDISLSLLGNHGFGVFSGLLLIGGCYFFASFLVKNVFNAGLIHLIRAYIQKNERDYRTMSALAFGWKKSVKLIEFHSLLFWSKPVYIFYIFFWGYRFLDGNWTLISIIALIFLIALVITRFIFEYCKYFIITQNSGVIESLGQSLTMTLENFGITLKIFFSLILVYFREIILLIGIFFLPSIFSWIITMGLAPIYVQGVFLLIGLVYLIFLIIVSAMNSVIEIFVDALWYSVFRDNLSGNSSDAHGHGESHGHGHDHHAH